MEIKINDMPIDYRLEAESTIGEVFIGIESWLRGNGHRIVEVLLDGTKLGEEQRATSEHPIDRVTTLEFTVESIRRKDIDDLETIRTFLGLFRRVLRSGDEEQLTAVLEELPYVVGGIERITPDLAGLLEEHLPGPLKDAAAHAAALDASARAKSADRARDLDRLLEQRQRELLDPDHEMRAVCTVLEGLVDRMEEIPAMLQSGGEKESLAAVGAFSETVSTFMRILPHVTDQHPDLEKHHEVIPEINTFLIDIERALSASDLVLLGDLLEYEIVPRFRELIAAVNETLGSAP